MKKKTTIIALITLVVIATTAYGLHEFFRVSPDMASLPVDYKINAPGLIKEFTDNDTSASKKFLGKIVEVNGSVRKIEKDELNFVTVVIGDAGDLSSIRCILDTNHKADATSLKEGISVTAKGLFIGYNKDATGLLGSDIQLTRCIFTSENKN